MKVIVAFLVLVACTAADDEWTVKTSEEVLQMQNDCLRKLPLKKEQFKQVNASEFPNEPEVRHFVLCTTEKIGIFSADVGYHADRISKQYKIKNVDPSVVEKFSEGCIAKFPKADYPNDVIAYEGHQCITALIREKKREIREQEAALNNE